MSEINIESPLIDSLIDFVAKFSTHLPQKEELQDFLSQKLKQREVFLALEQKLITNEEAIDFIVSHVFTKYVKGKSLDKSVSKELNNVNKAVQQFIDNNLSSREDKF